MKHHPSKTHVCEDDLVLIYYREPGLSPNAVQHLAECAQCRADFDALAETLNACLDWSAPEPPLDFGRSVWAGLAPRLEVEGRRPVRERIRALVAIAAAAVIVMGAFIAGRMSRHIEPSLTAGLSQQARERIFAISMADHLDRAEMLLTSLENVDEKDAQDFASQRERARDLVQEGRLMRVAVAARGKNAMLPVLDDVDRIVLEVANAPDHAEPAEIQELKHSIGANSLLFRIRIVESNLRSEGRKS